MYAHRPVFRTYKFYPQNRRMCRIYGSLYEYDITPNVCKYKRNTVKSI